MSEKDAVSSEWVEPRGLYTDAPKSWSMTDFVIVTLIAMSVFIGYWGTLHGEFLYDDWVFVKENEAVTHIWPVHRFFTSRLVYSTHAEFGVYRPLTPLSYAISLKLHGLNEVAFHLTNILLHCGCSVLLFVVLRRMFGHSLAAGLPALIFAVHPANTESVAWIAQRAGLLSLLFSLLALWLHQEAIRRLIRRKTLLIWAVAMFACALFSKEMAITLPVLLLVHDLFLVGRARRLPRRTALAYYGALFGVVVIFLLARMLVVGELAQRPWHGGTLTKNSLIVIASLGFYVRLAVWPVKLSVQYLNWVPSGLASPDVIAGLMAGGLLAGVVVMFYRVERRIAFGIMWFAITLLPVLNIIPIKTMYNDRFMYVPLVGFCMALAGLFAFVMRKRTWQTKGVVVALSTVLVLLGGFGTIRRNRDWLSWEKLLRASIRVDERHSFAWMELGTLIVDKDEKMAREYWKKAIEVNPTEWFARAKLGMSDYLEGQRLIKEGKLKEGETLYERAMEYMELSIRCAGTDYKQGVVHVCVADIFTHRGETDKAEERLRLALKMDPLCLDAYGKLANLLQKGSEAQRKEAVEIIVEAHRRWPENSLLARKAAGMLLKAKRPHDALRLLVKTINVMPLGTPERQEMERLAMELRDKMIEAERRDRSR